MVCVVALNLGCMVAYLNVLADVLSSVGGSIIPPGAEPTRALLLTGTLHMPTLDVLSGHGGFLGVLGIVVTVPLHMGTFKPLGKAVCRLQCAGVTFCVA